MKLFLLKDPTGRLWPMLRLASKERRLRCRQRSAKIRGRSLELAQSSVIVRAPGQLRLRPRWRGHATLAVHDVSAGSRLPSGQGDYSSGRAEHTKLQHQSLCVFMPRLPTERNSITTVAHLLQFAKTSTIDPDLINKWLRLRIPASEAEGPPLQSSRWPALGS